MSTTVENSTDNAWRTFVQGKWNKEIDVRDFIQKNYTPYQGDAAFLSGPTSKTQKLWQALEENYLSIERQKRVFDVDTDTPADIDAFGPGYISEEDDVIVGLQTDTPLKRAMMPNGGWRMVETAIKEAGKEINPEVKEIFTRYRKPIMTRYLIFILPEFGQLVPPISLLAYPMPMDAAGLSVTIDASPYMG